MASLTSASAKLDEARQLAASLLDEIETGTSPIEGILMKARRLARLMRESDAQTWLDYEISGYPSGLDFSTLGTCEQYARASGRITPEDKYYTPGLPELEANCKGNEAILEAFQIKPSGSLVMENYITKRATEEFIAGQIKMQHEYRNTFKQSKSLVVAMRAAVHTYVTDTYLAIQFGDVAQDIFEEARGQVDSFIRAHCPKAAEQLIAINERMAEKSSESRTAALTTCRRLLMTVADSLFPARDHDWVDQSGKKRKIGAEQYKNRLLAYLEDKTHSDGSQEVISSGLEHLAARLDAIYEKTCKGVHVEVSEDEARLTVIHTYLFVGELAKATSEAI